MTQWMESSVFEEINKIDKLLVKLATRQKGEIRINKIREMKREKLQ